MAYISTRQPPSTTNVENANISLDPYGTGSMGEFTGGGGAGTYNIPAGAYDIEIHNDGLTDITVNGRTLKPDGKLRYEARTNPATEKIDYCPAVAIVVSGAQGHATYSFTTPRA